MILMFMSEQNLFHLALWLETIGFALSAVLIIFIKWQLLEHILRSLKSFIVRLPNRLRTLFEPFVWLISHAATEGGKIPQGIEPKYLPVYTLRLIIHVVFVAPTLLILLTFLTIPMYLSMLITKLLSGRNTTTNLLIILGSFMILAGLIIELIISY
jgi:hypothetical protein